MPPRTRQPAPRKPATRTRKPPPPKDTRGEVRTALDDAVAKATHLTDIDAGAVAAARSLADKIDAWDVIVDWARDDAIEAGDNARPKVPANDNTSLPTFLRYLEALGLTPSSRAASKKPEGATGGGKLSLLKGSTPGARAGARSA